MLYERWRQIMEANRNELALHDAAADERWTFARLDNEASRLQLSRDQLACPKGSSPEFVLIVLRAWQSGQIVCPLEHGQTPPGFAGLPKECVHLKTTSATTGVPRFISFTGEQLIADAESIVTTMGLRHDWPNLAVISLAHSYGFSNLVLPLLLHGVPLILLNSPLPEAVRHTAALVPGVTLAAVPALWRIWHEANAIPPNVRLAISAGAPLPLPLEESVFRVAGLKLHNFYGSSECGGIAYDDSTRPRSDPACAGAPMHNVSLSVNDAGCLEVQSRAVGQTYWPEPMPSLGNGCYRTSDLAELRGGLVWLRGRAGDLINVAGRKVSPESIERILITHPNVKDCLIFGIPSKETERGEAIVAVVVGRCELTGDSLKRFLLARVPAWQLPREWRFVQSLEVNQRGKLSRGEWRGKILSGENITC